MKRGLQYLGWAIAVGLLAGVGRGVASTLESALPRFSRYERYIAIDGACGWPLITVLSDGNVACFLWPTATHGFTEGAVECWLSSDQGETWHKASVPVANDPTMNRMNHAAGVMPDGSLIALISGWDKRKPAGWRPDPADRTPPRNYFSAIGALTLPPVPAVSRDNGLTWVRYPGVVAEPAQGGNAFVPYGRINALPDGKLGVMMYYEELAFFVSGDGGKSWTKRSQVTTGRKHNETAWIVLANGDLYAAARSFDNQHLDGYRSTDGGLTWKFERELTLPMQHPADLTRLHDGRLLLSYGVRTEGRWGVEVRFGDPTAKEWSAPMELVDLEGATEQRLDPMPPRDGGYPSTVVLPDGSLLTAYYTRGIPAHSRYHVGVVKWKLTPEGDKRFQFARPQ